MTVPFGFSGGTFEIFATICDTLLGIVEKMFFVSLSLAVAFSSIEYLGEINKVTKGK